MQDAEKTPGTSSPLQQAVQSAAEALRVLLEAALRQPPEEAAIQQAAEALRGGVETASAALGEVNFFFAGGHFRFGALALDTDSPQLREAAQWFERAGLNGLCLRNGLTLEELRGLATILSGPNSEWKAGGLDAALARRGIRHVREARAAGERTGRLGREKSAASDGGAPDSPVWELDREG